MLLLAGFISILSFLMAGQRRAQKHKLAMEVNGLMATYNNTHKDYLEVVSEIAAINEINKLSLTEGMQKTLLSQTDKISDEIKILESEYKKIKPLYDKKKNTEEEEERKKRRRREAASGGGFYGGYSSSSSSSSSSYSSSSSSWGGGGGGFSGGGSSGSW